MTENMRAERPSPVDRLKADPLQADPLRREKVRVAFQGEEGAFSEAAAVQLLGDKIVTVPRPTFDATFRAIADGAADALLVPVETSLAGSVVRILHGHEQGIRCAVRNGAERRVE